MPTYFECLGCNSVTLLEGGAPICASCGHGTGLVVYRDDKKYAARARLAVTPGQRTDAEDIDQLDQVPST